MKVLALILFTLVTVSAFGGGSAPGSKVDPAPKSTPNRILEGRTIRVGVQRNKLVASSQEQFFWGGVALATGCSVNFVQVDDFSAFTPALTGKGGFPSEFDVISSGVSITGERASHVVFTAPYANVNEVLVVRRELAETAAQVISGTRKIGVIKDSIHHVRALELVPQDRVLIFSKAFDLHFAVQTQGLAGIIDETDLPEGFKKLSTVGSSSFGIALPLDSPLVGVLPQLNIIVSAINHGAHFGSGIDSPVNDLSIHFSLLGSPSHQLFHKYIRNAVCGYLKCDVQVQPITVLQQTRGLQPWTLNVDLVFLQKLEIPPSVGVTSSFYGNTIALFVPANSQLDTAEKFSKAKGRIASNPNVPWASAIAEYSSGPVVNFEDPGTLYTLIFNDKLADGMSGPVISHSSSLYKVIDAVLSVDSVFGFDLANQASNVIADEFNKAISMMVASYGKTDLGVNGIPPPKSFDFRGSSVRIAVQDRKLNTLGYERALWDAICKAYHCKVDWVVVDFSDIAPSLNNGARFVKDVDILSSGITLTGERSEYVAFSAPYYAVEQVLVVGASADSLTVDEFVADTKLTVGVSKGSTLALTALTMLPESRIVQVEGDVVATFLGGKASFDAVIVDSIDATGDGLRVVGPVRAAKDFFAFAVPRGSKWERRLPTLNAIARDMLKQ